ncbi:MAG TPA: aminotransferase class I/II-fold pyridoxal phosphate-dependent enzyme [Candidatus Acidoferrum sp.]|nr:aminotransferase class I/II-fold pyridoxal phosphate-dependent enzyme [Candidatus Acidoferrum sp.]
MQIAPFRIEEYFGKYEFTAKYLLSSSDAESRTIADLLSLEKGAQEAFLKHWCGYTETPGAPWLRETIASLYKNIRAEDVLVVAAAEEAIFLFYHALVGPGDHVIVETPCYESAFTLVKSTGATVSAWKRKPENDWAHDLAVLESLLQPNTRVIYINTPHNPTGLVMPVDVFGRVLELAAAEGIYVFCDEVYRELEHDPALRLPAACDLYDRAISLGSMSKAYGLPGLRLGWVASRDRGIVRKCTELKYYTTICSSAPSEFLSDLALRHRQQLVERNRQLLLGNLTLLTGFLARRSRLFSWTRPNGSPIGFVHFKLERDVYQFCETVVRQAGVLLLPGTVYDEPRYIRFGYGRANMPKALAQFDAWVAANL